MLSYLEFNLRAGAYRKHTSLACTATYLCVTGEKTEGSRTRSDRRLAQLSWKSGGGGPDLHSDIS